MAPKSSDSISNMMKNLGIVLAITTLLGTACQNVETKKEPAKKIVSIGGTPTEILYELGFEKEIVGVDVTSTYPATVAAKQQLGHSSRISAEAIIATGANTVVGLETEISDALKQTLEQSGIHCMEFPIAYRKEGTAALITAIADSLHVSDKGKQLVSVFESRFVDKKQYDTTPKVMFVYARGSGTLLIAGKNTALDAIIGMAGAENAVNEFEGFKPLNAEAVVSAAPDIILMFESGLKSLGTESLFSLPGMALTPAAKQQKVISMDSQFLAGFGPRLGDAVRELSEKIHQ